MALQKIGALWLKKGKKGTFMSGQVEIDGVTTNILIFKNNKTKDIHPDYQINVIVDDEPEQQAPQQNNNHGQTYYTPKGGNQEPAPGGFDDSGDVPF